MFECARVASLLRPTADLVRRGGQLFVGFPRTCRRSAARLADQGTQSSFLAYAHEDFVGAISAATQKRLDVLALHTATIGLGELAAMFEELDSGTTEHTKVPSRSPLLPPGRSRSTGQSARPGRSRRYTPTRGFTPEPPEGMGAAPYRRPAARPSLSK